MSKVGSGVLQLVGDESFEVVLEGEFVDVSAVVLDPWMGKTLASSKPVLLLLPHHLLDQMSSGKCDLFPVLVLELHLCGFVLLEDLFVGASGKWYATT